MLTGWRGGEWLMEWRGKMHTKYAFGGSHSLMAWAVFRQRWCLGARVYEL
jgi:hypothetical protein